MKRIDLLLFSAVVWSIAFDASADELGTGRDHDIPGAQPQPPAETETAATESLLQQLLEFFDLSADQ